MVLVFVEHADGELDELSLQALTLRARLRRRRAARRRDDRPRCRGRRAGAGRARRRDRARGRASTATLRAAGVGARGRRARRAPRPAAVVAAGSDRGNEVLAHAAVMTGGVLAANCVRAAPGDPAEVTRMRWGGSLLEEARLHGAGEADDRRAARGRDRARRGRRARGRALHAGAARRRTSSCGCPSGSTRRPAGSRSPRRPSSSPAAAASARRRASRRSRSSRGAARRRRRLLARGHERRLAAAHRPGRPDGDEDLARAVHPVRDQRRDAAHGRLQGREEAAGDQRRPRGGDHRERGLRGRRRPERDRAGDHRRAAHGSREGCGRRPASALALAAALAVCGGLFARRALLLVRLVRMGKPSGIERADDVPGPAARRRRSSCWASASCSSGSSPGLMHAFIFWGFLVLFPTIVIAMIGIVDREATLPWLGEQGWFALLVDVFAVLVLVGVGDRRCGSARSSAPRRFEGSHLGEADLILAWIAGIVARCCCGTRRGSRCRSTSTTPAGRRSRTRSRACSATATSTEALERVARLGPRAADPGLPRLPAALQAPAHRHRGDQRLLRPHPRARPARAAAVRRGRARGGHALRHRDGRGPDLEADDGRDVLHRVRALPGRLPGVGDRQDAVAEAA